MSLCGQGHAPQGELSHFRTWQRRFKTEISPQGFSDSQTDVDRYLVDWALDSLAIIHRAESVDGKTAMTFANASAIRRALENAGVELIEENGGGPGARLKRRLG